MRTLPVPLYVCTHWDPFIPFELTLPCLPLIAQADGGSAGDGRKGKRRGGLDSWTTQRAPGPTCVPFRGVAGRGEGTRGGGGGRHGHGLK